jgi:hypothetical protein
LADLGRDLRFVVAAAQRAISQLRSAGDANAESGLGKALHGHLAEALAAIDARIQLSASRFNAATTDVERRGALEALRLMNRYLNEMQEASVWMRPASEPQLNIGLVYFLDEAASDLISADVEILTTGDATYDYATISWPFRRVLAALGRATTGSVRPVVVFYPPQESESLLLHALFAHELAHHAIDQHNLVDAVLASHLAAANFAQAFESAAQDLATRHGAPLPAGRIGLRVRLRDWVEELLCDALATQYVGPSFIFAFGAVVLATSWNEPQERHPPTTLRVELMLEQLQHLGWTGLLSAEVPETLAWFEDVAGAAVAAGAPYEQFLIDSARRVAADVRAQAAGRLDSRSLAPGDYAPVADEIRGYLRQRILPAQRTDGRALPRRTILLGGWLYAFASSRDDPATVCEAASGTEFQQFLATALEMSTILETWRSV